MRQGMNQDESISFVLFAQAVRSNPSGDNSSFSLTDLGRHNILEHDCSLRYDIGQLKWGEREKR